MFTFLIYLPIIFICLVLIVALVAVLVGGKVDIGGHVKVTWGKHHE